MEQISKRFLLLFVVDIPGCGIVCTIIVLSILWLFSTPLGVAYRMLSKHLIGLLVFYNNSVPSVFPFSNENEITAYTAVLASVSGKTHFVTHLKGYKEDMGRIIKETFSENVILISGKTISTQTLVICATRLSY